VASDYQEPRGFGIGGVTVATLLECADELDRIHSRARLLEYALVHGSEETREGVYAEAVARQSQDIVNDLEALIGELSEAIKGK
jgi:hypothetical protein